MVLMPGELLHLHDSSCNLFFFKLRYVVVLHECMKTELCFTIIAREHLAVRPESQRALVLLAHVTLIINGDAFSEQDRPELSPYTW